jgi:hypothetical protein
MRILKIMALAAALPLAACFVTEKPLYTEADAAMPPLTPGLYELTEEGDTRGQGETFRVSIDGKTLVMDQQGEGRKEETRVLLIPQGEGLYIAQTALDDSAADTTARVYLIAESLPGGGLAFDQPDCKVYAEFHDPAIAVELGDSCAPRDRAALEAAFALWREELPDAPKSRLVRTGD